MSTTCAPLSVSISLLVLISIDCFSHSLHQTCWFLPICWKDIQCRTKVPRHAPRWLADRHLGVHDRRALHRTSVPSSAHIVADIRNTNVRTGCLTKHPKMGVELAQAYFAKLVANSTACWPYRMALIHKYHNPMATKLPPTSKLP